MFKLLFFTINLSCIFNFNILTLPHHWARIGNQIYSIGLTKNHDIKRQNYWMLTTNLSITLASLSKSERLTLA